MIGYYVHFIDRIRLSISHVCVKNVNSEYDVVNLMKCCDLNAQAAAFHLFCESRSAYTMPFKYRYLLILTTYVVESWISFQFDLATL